MTDHDGEGHVPSTPDGGAPRETQRRHATVVFADISGFTAMSETLDPEDVTEIINDCFAMMERIVHRHGGEVDKYIGDAMMALFGGGRALEHASRHAVDAALEIRTALARFNDDRRLPVPLEIHIGINSGLVIAGEVGGRLRRDFTVMGDTVNVAARLEDAAGRGQILVGPVTCAETDAVFEYRVHPPLEIKGKGEVVHAYEALGVRQRTADPFVLSTRQVSSALVGRERELAAVRERVERLLRGEGAVMTIVGEAGLGKSRLLNELGGMIDPEQATVLVGRSDALGAGLGFHPLADLLRHWIGWRREDGEGVIREKLATAVRRDADAAAGPAMLPFLGMLLGVRPAEGDGVEGEALETLLMKSVHDLMASLARRRPLLLCLEDVHWADGSSVKLLESLLRLCGSYPVLVALVFRPGFPETADRLVAAARTRCGDRLTEIALQPLDVRSTHRLLCNLLRVDTLPEAARRLIAGTAEGNPFYLEEVVRTLIDAAAIEARGGQLIVTERVDRVTVPGTVQEIILSRVERLPPDARRVLQTAAVIGRTFSPRLLADVTGLDLSALEPLLALLRERQVIRERTYPRVTVPPRASGELAFAHVLIAETLYASLLHRTRRDLHLRIAEAIERQGSEQTVDLHGMLALHYTRAEKLDDAERHLLRAGEAAVGVAASSEALGHFLEAYRLYRIRHPDGGDRAKRARLEKQIAAAMLAVGNLTEARPYFDRALELLGERVARTKRQAYRQLGLDLARMLIRIYVLRGHPARQPATPELKEALDLLYSRARVESVADPEWFLFDSMYMVGRLTTVDPRTVERAFAQWAGVSLLFSFSGLSFAVSRRVARFARSLLRAQHPGDLFTYHLMSFMSDYFEGRWSEPCGIDDPLIERVLETGQLWDVDTFLGFEAGKQIDRGAWDAAESRWRQICRIADDYGYKFAETNKMAIPIFAAVARRDLARALIEVERYLERPEEKLNLIGLGVKAKVLVLLDRLDEARATLDVAERLSRRLGRVTPFHRAWPQLARLLYDVTELGRSLERHDRTDAYRTRRRAARSLRAALRTSRVLAPARTETYRLAGSLFWLSGRRRRAVRWWSRSLEEGARLGARPELARTHAEVAVRMAARPGAFRAVGGLSAAEHAERARDAFRDLGLAHDLAALDAALEFREAPSPHPERP